LPKIIGNYNPDWGIVCYDDDGKLRLHIVRETKGAAKISALQFPSEGRKITCAARHFKTLGISYRHITDKQLRWWADEGSPDPGKMFD
jgi:type III restriction enzyme